jgi:solute carrier family 25 phosphate transporter 23/24/25/41
MAELQKELRESQNQRDKRIEELWRTLGPNKKGELDMKGLQKGLRKIDHREYLPPCQDKKGTP